MYAMLDEVRNTEYNTHCVKKNGNSDSDSIFKSQSMHTCVQLSGHAILIPISLGIILFKSNSQTWPTSLRPTVATSHPLCGETGAPNSAARPFIFPAQHPHTRLTAGNTVCLFLSLLPPRVVDIWEIPGTKLSAPTAN